jgi:hypothetical protein
MNDYNPIVFVLIIFAILILSLVSFDYVIYNDLIENENQLHWFLSTLLFEVGTYKKFLQGIFLFKIISTLCLAGAVWLLPSRGKHEKKNRTINTIILAVFSVFYWLGFMNNHVYDLLVYPTIVLCHILLIIIVISSYRNVLKDENILGVTSKGLNDDTSFQFKVNPDKENK